MQVSSLKSRAGSLLREARLHFDILRRSGGGPRLLYFPSQGPDDGAARLRAYAMADALRPLGWRTAVCPKHVGLAGRRRLIRHLRPDLVVMQTARHPLNRPHLYPSSRVVIDLDDADYIDPVSAAPLAAALEASVGAIAGSRTVADYCRRHTSPVTVIWTGTPPSTDAIPPQANRRPVVTWAASAPVGSRGEAAFLKQVLAGLAARGLPFTFRIYSDDGSDGYRRMVQAIVPERVAVETFPYLSYDAFLSSLDDVAVGLAPLVDMDGFSSGKSFGKVLAYIDRRVPVITHPVVDHPLFFRSFENGILADGVDGWISATALLLGDGALRDRIADAARSDLLNRLSTATAARLTDRFLRGILDLAGPAQPKTPISIVPAT